MARRNLWTAIWALMLSALLVGACNFPPPSATEDPFPTFAAQTVAARLTEAGGAETPIPPPQATTPPAPLPTVALPSPTASNTPLPTATQAPCDRASFISDVTVPDGTDFAPGESFTKTWRLKNTGTCTWTSDYDLVFDQGDAMDGPASKPLTAASVAPGQTMDISVDLKAPGTTGTYKGFWKLRNDKGVLFGVGAQGDVAFWVEIDVVQPTTTVDVASIDGESGSVRSNGSVLGPANVGDTSSDASSQAFVSFDISAIPADATITKVVADFSNYDTLGNPFADLGCLDLYQDNYGSLDAGDYFGGSPSGRLMRWCSTSALDAPKADDDMIGALQSAVGGSRFKVRFQFQTDVSNDSEADMVRLNDSNLALTISYYTP